MLINQTEGFTLELDGTTLTAEKKYSINFTENNKKFCLSWYYNEANSCLFVYVTEIHKFKVKDSEIVAIHYVQKTFQKTFSR